MAATIQFRTDKASRWVSGYDFEQILKQSKEKLYKNKKALTIVIQARACAPLNTLIRLLNVANQLDSQDIKVTLKFSGKTNNLLGYCNAIGFFECLSSSVLIKSDKTWDKSIKVKATGGNYVSIHQVSGPAHDKSLPDKLADKITSSIPNISQENRKALYIQFFSLFSELTRNVCEHSQTELSGFAALQAYGGANSRAEIVVCDSGIGLLESLKPSLNTHNKAYEGYSDLQLIKKMLTTGISSKPGDLGGNGLCTCFNHARATNSDMHIRLNDTYYHLFKVAEHSDLERALRVSSNLLDLSGTLISFVVPLNK